MRQTSISCARLQLLGCTALVAMVANPAVGQTKSFDVPAQSAARGIPAFGKQAGVQLVASGSVVRGKQTNSVRGSYEVAEGLRTLLHGTGLEAGTRIAGTGIIPIRAVAPTPVRRASGALTRLAMATTTAAVAQDSVPVEAAQAAPAAGGLEDIVVTARRNAESLMRVPVSESVVSAQALARYNVADLSGIANNVPSVRLERTGSVSGSAMTIRGIGSADTDSAVEQSVSVSIDGMQISKAFIVQQAMFDLTQVEILKGPQALFFGKNVSAGVVALHSANPGDKFEAYLKAGYEFNAREKIVEGAVSGPLSDTFGARLAVRGSQMRGWMKNDAQPQANPFFPAFPLPGTDDRHNGNKDLYGRLTLVYEPSSDFKATLKAYGGVQRDNGSTTSSEVGNCGAPPLVSYVAGGVNRQDPNSDCTLNGHQSIGGLPAAQFSNLPVFKDGQPYGKYDAFVGSLTLEYDAGPLNITSTTGYHWFDTAVVANTTHSVYPYGGSLGVTYTFKQFAQELRAVTELDGPLNFTFGGYFGTDSLDHEQNLVIFPLPADPATGRSDTAERIAKPSGKSYSVFAQARWDITPEVELAGGARYSSDHKKGVLGVNFVHPAIAAFGLFAPAGTVFRDKKTFNNFSPEASLTWRPHSDLMVYAAYKTGYKAGGFSAPAQVPRTAAPVGSIPGVATVGFNYDPEKVKGGEIGLKAQLFDRSLRWTTTLYQYDYTDLQLSSFSAAPVPTFIILNAGKLRTKGIETELLWKASDTLTVHGSAAYNRARYVDFEGINCYSGQSAAQGCLTRPVGHPLAGSRYQDLSGQITQKAPKWTLNAGFSFDQPIGTNMVFGLSADARYTSKYLLQPDNNPFAIQDEYAAIDASVRVGAEDDSWQVALIGRNLTNKYYAVSSLNKPGGATSAVNGTDLFMAVGRPRQIQLNFSVRY